jgi:hypothetical protein
MTTNLIKYPLYFPLTTMETRSISIFKFVYKHKLKNGNQKHLEINYIKELTIRFAPFRL